MSRLTRERVAEIHTGTLRLVIEHGFDNVTMDQIAEATRSSKATLYRQWGGKVALFVEALRSSAPHDDELPDTGSLRGDLLADIASKGGADEAESELIAALMHAMKQDAELDEAVRTQIVEPGRDRIRTMLQRAIDRGEIAADNLALPFADLLFISPFVLRPLLDGRSADPTYITDYYDGVLLPALGMR